MVNGSAFWYWPAGRRQRCGTSNHQCYALLMNLMLDSITHKGTEFQPLAIQSNAMAAQPRSGTQCCPTLQGELRGLLSMSVTPQENMYVICDKLAVGMPLFHPCMPDTSAVGHARNLPTCPLACSVLPSTCSVVQIRLERLQLQHTNRLRCCKLCYGSGHLTTNCTRRSATTCIQQQ